MLEQTPNDRLIVWLTVLSASVLLAASMVASASTNPQSRAQEIKTLQDSINRSKFESTESKTGKSESYQYDALQFHDCSLGWTETHEIRGAGRRILLERIDVTVPLRVLDATASRSEKLKNSGYLVSLLTRKLEPGINTRNRIELEDGSENESTAIQTGYAFYFSDATI